MSVVGRAWRDFAYLTLAALSGCLAMVVWVTGVSLLLTLAVFIVGILVVLPVSRVFEWTCNLDRANARLAGVTIGSRYRRAGGDNGARLLDKVKLTGADPQRWRDLAWLIVQSVLGLPFGVLALSLLASGLIGLSLPLTWEHWPGDDVVWAWLDIDTQGKAWIAAAIAIAWLLATVAIARLLTFVHVTIAKALLAPLAERPQPTAEMPANEAPADEPQLAGSADAEPAVLSGAAVEPEDMNRLLLHGGAAAAISVLMLIIWAGSGFGTFWPVWVWLGLAVSVAAHVLLLRARQYPGDWLRLSTEASLVVVALSVLIWVFSGFGSFWPFWVAVGLGSANAVAAAVVTRPWEDRVGLLNRVETLVRTRTETVDAQANELRRIERDLHDGAQARLVALSMQLGRAEARLADRPEEAELIRSARAEAGAAIAELRDLARGIAPPVLADRGLVAAVDALCQRSAVDVRFSAQVPDGSRQRLPLAVESCAYFVCAEGLTNVAKHAAGASAEVELRRERGTLICEVRDNGPGGADPSAPGLTGLRQRVAALDGRLLVDSPSGGGTTIRAEIPCA